MVELNKNYTPFTTNEPGLLYKIKTYMVSKFKNKKNQTFPVILRKLGFISVAENIEDFSDNNPCEWLSHCITYKKCIDAENEIYQYVLHYPETKRFTIQCRETLSSPFKVHPQFRIKEFKNLYINDLKKLKFYLKLITFDEKMR